MTIAQSIVRTTFMIKELAAWLEADIHKDGYCMHGSMSEIDLKIAENVLRHLADKCRDQREALLVNQPGPFDATKPRLKVMHPDKPF